jgi:hypothetical protein
LTPFVQPTDNGHVRPEVSPFVVVLEVSSTERHWPPAPSRWQAFVEGMQNTQVFRDVRYPRPQVTLESGTTAIVRMVTVATTEAGASAAAERIIISHATHRPVELAPAHTLALSVRSVAPFSIGDF